MTYLELIAKLTKEMAANPGLSIMKVQFAIDTDDLYPVSDIEVADSDYEFRDGSTVSEGTLILIA